MSSPRKFAEKIALIQQKQAEGDAAFNTIIYEVEAAKQRADRVSTGKIKLDVPIRKYDKPFENYQECNGMNNLDDNSTNNYPQTIQMDNGHEADRLLQPPDNSSWRRTHSDSSLHHTIMPSVAAHYHNRIENDNNGQASNYDMIDIKYEPSLYSSPSHHPHHLQVSNSPFQQQHHQFDLNHNINPNYMNGRTNMGYSLAQMATPIGPTASLPTQPVASAPSNNTHTLLGPRYSGGSTGSNVLMLPPNHHPRGGSLPDLRTENTFHHQQVSFSTTPSPPTSTTQHFFRSSSPQQNGDGDLYSLGPQQQLPSRIGPLKQSPSIRRRHSPIGEVKQTSPRRQNSPSPDVLPNQQTVYRVEPSSPQSQSSYSPQNSPHLLPSPGNDLGPFSPQQSTDNNQQQPYFTLPTHFDQITLDNNFYTQQQQQHQQQSSSSQQQNPNHSPTANSVLTSLSNDMNGIQLNYFRPRNIYPNFLDDISASYCQTQTTVTVSANVNQKSPTIPNIILTDVDSSKLDLSKELANDFSNTFDSLIDPTDLQLNAEDFLLNASDLSIDPNMCDDTFRMEN
ncbi:unnamed protein product [Adineta steineri]|uniref:Transducer of regulated CREB activity N-terminal domain-containing protein n=1 Tax=Adineta steineri TaxID=433720 RepID=A0A814EFT7_9BILA|nr:unnamed protein product [Adineta steineri]CAF0968336.1 unnamed protein product [Adineta steineri]